MKEKSDEQLRAMLRQEERDIAGIREPGQPSEVAHELYLREVESEFSKEERRIIRYRLDLL